jgi:hypothetical protein
VAIGAPLISTRTAVIKSVDRPVAVSAFRILTEQHQFFRGGQLATIVRPSPL